jgi:retron-type reverse transcriptase
MDSTLYGRLRSLRNLDRAWQAIRANSATSTSRQTKDEVAEFAKNVYGNLRRIQARLKKNRYEFAPAKGVSIKREGKRPRPLVLACVQDRVVQRAILQVLSNHNFTRIPRTDMLATTLPLLGPRRTDSATRSTRSPIWNDRSTMTFSATYRQR